MSSFLRSQESILERCKQVGSDLCNSPGESKPLRALEHDLKACLYDAAHDANLRFLCFFLTVFVEDVFYNVAADVVYPSADEDIAFLQTTRRKIMESIGRALVGLATTLQGGAPETCYQSYAEVTEVYLNSIHALNERTKKSS